MSGVWLLLGLLLLAYAGSMLLGAGKARGYGLPSGAEYLLLGLVLGPHFLAAVPRATILSFEPVMLAALGWLCAVTGVDYGIVGERPIAKGSLVLGVLLSVLSSAAAFAVVLLLGQRVLHQPLTSLLPLALCLAVCLSETTRHAVRMVSERHGANGPLADLLSDVADADDAFPVVAAALLLCFAPGNASWNVWLQLGVTLGAGAVLGLVTATLMGRHLQTDETWGLILGAGLLGIGVATHLELSPLTLMFVFGLTLANASGRGAELREMMGFSERLVLAPILLLAGALVDFRLPGPTWLLIGAALLARLASRGLGGALLGLRAEARGAGMALGLATTPSGAMSVCIGLLVFVSFPPDIGAAVLVACVLSSFVGELIGTTALVRTLRRKGELRGAPDSSRELTTGEPAA